MGLHHQAVGAGRSGRQRQRDHQSSAASGVGRIDDYRQMSPFTQHRHGRNIQGATSGALEGPNAALAEEHLRLASRPSSWRSISSIRLRAWLSCFMVRSLWHKKRPRRSAGPSGCRWCRELSDRNLTLQAEARKREDGDHKAHLHARFSGWPAECTTWTRFRRRRLASSGDGSRPACPRPRPRGEAGRNAGCCGWSDG